MQITINNRVWKIKFVSENNKNLCQSDGEQVCGITHYRTSTIYIVKTLEKSLMFDTLVHELTHAYLFVYGFAQFESFTEENVCDVFGAFAQDLIHNAQEIIFEKSVDKE